MNNLYYYTDRKVVLGYLSNTSKCFTRYVSRRIEIISNMCSDRYWNYINTDDNPADIASRPQEASILTSIIWLHGPKFLSLGKYKQPEVTVESTYLELPEENISSNSLRVKYVNTSVFEVVVRNVSSLSKIIRISKYVFSLCNNVDRAKQRLGISLAPRPNFNHVDGHEALHAVIRDIQGTIDIEELRNFSPILDNCGLWRVGGRLKNAFLPIDGRNPIIVQKESGLARLLVDHYHKVVKHQGRQISLAALRSAGYFIEGGRRLVNSVISSW